MVCFVAQPPVANCQIASPTPNAPNA